jgi:hypothetical protein
MQKTRLAVAGLLAAALGGPPTADSQGLAVPRIGPVATARDREVRTLTVGSVSIEVTAGAAAAIEALHRERGPENSGDPGTMARSDARMQAQNSLSSLFFRLTDRGELLGLLSMTGDQYQPIKISMAELARRGDYSKVVISATQTRDRAQGLAVLAYTPQGAPKSIMLIEAFSFRSVELH